MFVQNLFFERSQVILYGIVLMVAMALSSLIPPMQSPDEDSHITRAYLLSTGSVLLQPAPRNADGALEDRALAAYIARTGKDGRIGGWVDRGLLSFMAGYLAMAAKPDLRISATDEDRLAQLGWANAKAFVFAPGTGYYMPAIYLPQALGLALGRGIDLSVANSYRLARWCTLLACFALLLVAARLMRPAPIVIAIVLLPMSLFQLLSPTLDGLTTALSVLTISLFLKSADPGSRHSVASSWCLAACIFLLASSRTHLLTLLALPFFLAWQRQSRRDFYLGCWVSLSTLGWVAFALHSTIDPRIVRDQTTTELLLQYAAAPLSFFRVVLASLTDRDLFTFYEQTFVGILGWLDTRLPAHFYPSLWTGLGLCALISVSVSTLRKDWRVRLLLVGMALASVALIFLAMLVTWTPHPALLVQGVQGRYFVAPMILLGYAMSGFAAKKCPSHRRFAGLVLLGFALCSITALTTTLLTRYH